jgi:DNA-binding response OmpR family regulator
MSDKPRVLVIDDEPAVRGMLRTLLDRSGFVVSDADSGSTALRSLYDRRPDVVLLDINMPGLDGWHVLARIRELSDVPVILLTGYASESEKVRGLQAGADDYISKPFGRQELVARLKALLRRTPEHVETLERYDDPRLTVDFRRHEVLSAGEPVHLTALEFRLLSAFVAHPGQVLSHAQLLTLAWGSPDRASRDQVKLYVSYLRRKLETSGWPDGGIETERGFGYRYRPPVH